jgi:hypothetical protein
MRRWRNYGMVNPGTALSYNPDAAMDRYRL